MNRISAVLVALACLFGCSQAYADGSASSPQQPASLDGYTESKILYLHDKAKLALDLNWEFLERWQEPVFLSLGGLERGHKDELFVLMRSHGLDPLVETGTEGEYGIAEHSEAYERLHAQGWKTLLEAYRAVAYVEEWNISEMRVLMEITDEPSVVNALAQQLAGAENHLRTVVSHIEGLGHGYQAQVLNQLDVDEICSGVEPYSGTNFTMNGGLNDAWYYPLTAGQGFFVSVYPALETVFVSWMSYDTVLPADGTVSHLGDAGQRWLVAEGKYVGNRAELTVYSTSGGAFDKVGPPVEMKYTGQMVLQFDDCARGSVWYVLEPLWGGNMMPIERVVPGNTQVCELFAR